MTAATVATPLLVPVRTWQAKACLAAAIAKDLEAHYEEAEASHLWCSTSDLLLSSDAANLAIDELRQQEALRKIAEIEHLLYALRDIEPSEDARLEVAGTFPLIEAVDKVIEDLVDTKVSKLIGNTPTQREIAEATIIAIDLRDELVGEEDA